MGEKDVQTHQVQVQSHFRREARAGGGAECGAGEQQRVTKDRFMITAFNLDCVPCTEQMPAKGGFTEINQVIYKQVYNNKWMQYNQQPLLHVCLLLNVVEGVYLNVTDASFRRDA